MSRPRPDTLLKRAQDEEQKAMRGKLKIYLGAAPGVGKTFTMLQDAHAKRAQGLDVVVGIVETHKRKEIESLLENIEMLPRLSLDYHGNQLTEFDIDAAIKRNPGLILIDEMAHTNIPGLRHEKRWQDIKEILDSGIDVYTTLNVQHIESLNDVVSQIIHTRVKETVPDSMLELADSIELVDLPPEDLLKRLQEGKVYYPKQAELAAENFFRKGNLIALRELALRVTAERVSEQVLLYRQGLGIKHIWPTREKILVCVGSRAESAKLIRAARRMAIKLQADWIAVHVDVPRIAVSEAESNNVVQNLQLAEKLGAETRILMGFDIVKEVTDFAREQNITMIMVWKHIRPRWKDFIFGSLADELTRKSGEIDMYVVTSETEVGAPEIHVADQEITRKEKTPLSIYAASILAVIASTALNILLFPQISSASIVMIYLLGVTFVALFGRLIPSIMATVLSILSYNFFFTLPFYTVYPADLTTLLVWFLMFILMQIISYITISARKQVETASLVQQDTAILHTLSRQLSATRGADKLVGIAVSYIAEVFDSDVLMLLPENDILAIRAAYGMEPILDAKEFGVAQWVYHLGESAGLGTDTLSFSNALYLPVIASQGCRGVIMVRPKETIRPFSQEQRHLLESCANQIALALEVDSLHDQSKKLEVQINTDDLRLKLMKTVSHDLRTPLAAVMGASSTLLEMGAELDGPQIQKLAKQIYQETEQLSRLISNLMQMTYFEADAVQLKILPHSLKETIAKALKSLKRKIDHREVRIKLPDDLPAISYDETLIQDVLINLLDNALKFTQAESPIEISVIKENHRVVVSVEDRGPGIVYDEVNKLFEKYYRGRLLTTERGLGLGLAICYSIIKMHGGEIWAENRPGGGAIFRFTLISDLKN